MTISAGNYWTCFSCGAKPLYKAYISKNEKDEVTNVECVSCNKKRKEEEKDNADSDTAEKEQ